MSGLRSVIGWLLRHGFLYVLLVAALLLGGWLGGWIGDGADREARYQALEAAREELRGEYPALQREYERARQDASRAGVAEIDRRIGEIDARLRAYAADPPGIDIAGLVREGPSHVVENEKKKLRIALLQREKQMLQEARALATVRGEADRFDRERTACLAARKARRAYLETHPVQARLPYANDPYRRLEEDQRQRCDQAAATLARIRRQGDLATRLADARAAFAQTSGDLSADLDAALAGLDEAREEASAAWLGSAQQRAGAAWRNPTLQHALWAALGALVLIIATPFLIRLLFWFVLAPLAERRPAIRIRVPGGHSAAASAGISVPGGASSASVPISLREGEELLVRQDYLQTTSSGGTKSTKWLLDPRHPLTSHAAGLVFLTRVRGAGEVTTISAISDPFAEVTVLELAEGAACVLQPRALAAVVQPIEAPLRITSHWRLFSLNAWLTLQLRFLVFHGPCRLVVKGGRGVRIERAERGRVFGSAQLVGFTADLAYSVTRNETFWPYFLGRVQLFRDRVEAGEGLLVIEEAPMAGRFAKGAKHGLEGAFDVATKALGI
ncbi:hypothetical protein [Novosphingobium aquimarinum]|uniref:hypothetical protein n=1 Tax=Novosphingobium aquimarinum TaxID=2682494 RepID=UPI0012EBA576|nr:hypothetical protein [Novosphingobium aquimarinum]